MGGLIYIYISMWGLVWLAWRGKVRQDLVRCGVDGLIRRG